MPLLKRLQQLEPIETRRTMEWAAEERFYDGLDLATGREGRRMGAIYLFGYVAEMLLKAASAREGGLGETDNIVENWLCQARKHAQWTKGANLHDLVSWLTLLLHQRKARGVPLDSAFAGNLQKHILTLASHWQETLRYKYTGAEEAELDEVFQSVDWLVANRHAL